MRFSYILTFYLLIIYSKSIFSQEKISIYDKEIPCYQNNQDSIAYEGENLIYRKIKTPEIWYYPSEIKVKENPAVIVIPGGGYAQLSFEKEGTHIAEWLNKIGVDAFVLKHRLPANYYGSCKQMVAFDDAKEAINLIRENSSKFKIDPNMIGVIGFSAGGHLASSLSNHKIIESRPNFSVLLYPVITMNPKNTNLWTFTSLFGDKPNEEMILKFSNELNVDSYTPPTIIIHSDNDMVVVPENSIDYYSALRKNNIPSALHIWEDGGHGYGLGKGRGSIESWPTIVEEWMRLRRIID